MAFTTLPAAGAKLRGSVLSAAFGEVRPITARKTIDESLQNNTMQDDNELAVVLDANATYRIAADIISNSGTTPDISYAWSIPSGAGGLWTVTALVSSALYLGVLTWAQTAAVDGTAADNFHRLEGVMVTSSAGTLQFRWAQTTTTATNTTVKANSLLVATRVA